MVFEEQQPGEPRAGGQNTGAVGTLVDEAGGAGCGAVDGGRTTVAAGGIDGGSFIPRFKFLDQFNVAEQSESRPTKLPLKQKAGEQKQAPATRILVASTSSSTTSFALQ